MNTEKKHSVIWITGGALSEQLHQAARIKPAKYLADFGWDVTLVTGKTLKEDDGKNQEKITELKKMNIPVFGTLLYHFKVLYLIITKRLNGNIVYFQTKSAPFILLLPLLQKCFNVIGDLKFVMDTRTVPMDTEGVRGKIRKLSFDACHKMANKIGVYQTAITDEMVKYVGIPRDKLISIWQSGVELEEFKKCKGSRKWPDEEDAIKIVYIGVIRKERNLESAIDAVAKARAIGMNVELNIVGDGPHVNALKSHNEVNGKNGINILPPVKRRFVPDILADNHIGLLPFPDVPKMRVSSAIKMFEYMAAGMPIIATRIAAHINVFKSNDFVFWDMEANHKTMLAAIVEANQKKNDLKKYGEQSFELGKNFTWRQSAEKLSDGFYSII